MKLALRTLALTITAVVVYASVPHAAPDAIDRAYAGTWRINLAKSKYENANPPKSSVRRNEDRGDGTVVVWMDTVNAQGVESHSGYTYRLDGREYPMAQLGATKLQTIALKAVDPYTVEYTFKQDGKVVATGRRVLAKDGKSMVVETRRTDAQGRTSVSSDYFEKAQ